MLRLDLLFFSTLKISDVVCENIFLENISFIKICLENIIFKTDALSTNNNEQKLQELNYASGLLQLNKCAKNWSHCKYSNKEKTLYRKCNMSGKLKLKPNIRPNLFIKQSYFCQDSSKIS